MKGNRLRQSFALLAAATLVASAGTARAQVTKGDAGCRAAIQKNAGKLGATAMKTIDGCIKGQLKSNTGANCNSLAVADTKGKAAKAVSKVGPGVAKKCTEAGNPLALAEFPSCPSPANTDDDGGATTGTDTFAELAACEVTINTDNIETLRNYILKPDAAAILAHPDAKNIAKCGNAIAKSATKLWGGISKGLGKVQATSDKGGGSYNYTAPFAPTANPLKAAFAAAVVSKCSLPGSELALLHSCDTSAAGIGACAGNAIAKNAGGATQTAFEFAGVCPTEVRIEVNAGTGGGTSLAGNGSRLTNTRLDTGWTGLGHKVDVVDGFVGRVNLSCSNGDCNSCTVTSNCEAGNCRCKAAPQTQCGTPFVQDVCAPADVCVVMFGPPLALSAGGSPTCVVNSIEQEISGVADVGTGKSTTTVNNIAKVFLGIGQNKPCPTCSGATIGTAGTCSGGSRNNLGCTTNAIHPDFGATSYSCPPTLGSNISGGGLKINLTLTDGNVSLPFQDACDAPLGSQTCLCGQCSGDPTVSCGKDTDCSGLGLGTCNNTGAGVNRQPNSCSDLSCIDTAPVGDGDGECNIPGDQDKFCSGILRQDGTGILACNNDADCTALNSECPGSNCGTCTIVQRKRCFLDPVTAKGIPGQDGAELVSTFCASGTNNAGINGAGGVPGGGRLKIDWDFTGYCPSPGDTTEFMLGGSNCP